MEKDRGHPNRIGIWGWVMGGSWGPDRYLYSLHRITGLGLLLYFLLHIYVTSSRAISQGAWEESMARFSGPLFELGEFLVFVAFAFHAINGVRLLFAELGFAVGKPIEPIYPYRTCLDNQRPWALGALLLIVVLVVIGALDFFVWH